ncbi:MAG: EamA family transporter [Chloroflexota bacterium]
MTENPPSRWLLVAAFAAVYLIWGSSYLGIHFAIQTLPPFLMTGMRFVFAGALLFGWARLRGTPMPTRANWKAALISGGILFVLNNGAIVWAEGHGLPSGIAAVLIATLPMWIVLLTWLRPGGTFPGGIVIAGLIFGFIGILLLFDLQGNTLYLPGVVAVLFGAFAWAYGSLYAKNAPLPKSTALATGMQLLCGGLLQFAIAIPTGELASFDPAQVSTVSWLAMLYLAIVSSIIAYSAFAWLMRVTTPTKVSTYAYVNPVVAVFLGWWLANEPLTPRTLIAAAIIIGSVIMINGYKGKTPLNRRFRQRLRRHRTEAVKVTP